jgi:hypothetical protein
MANLGLNLDPLGFITNLIGMGQNQKNFEKEQNLQKEQWNQSMEFQKEQFAHQKEQNEWQKQFSQNQFDYQKGINDWQQKFNQEQFQYQKNIAENKHQIMVKDLEKAGLNPVLAAGSGAINASPVSGGVSSGSSGSPSLSSGSHGSPSSSRGSGNVSAGFSNSSGVMLGAQMDAQIASLRSQASLNESLATRAVSESAYYDSLVHQKLPSDIAVAEREVGTKEAQVDINKEVAKQATIPVAQAQVPHIEAQTKHEEVLTQQAQYSLEHTLPTQYENLLLENRLKEKAITGQQMDNIRQQLQNSLLEKESALKQLQMNQMVHQNESIILQNALTQYIVDSYEMGVNYKQQSAHSIAIWLDKNFNSLPKNVRGTLSVFFGTLMDIWKKS